MSKATSTPLHRSLVIAASLLSFGLIGTLLYAARDILIPVVLAILLAFLLSPVVRRLDRLGLNRIVAVVMAIGLAGVLLSAFILSVGSELQSLADDVPAYRRNWDSKIQSIRGIGNGGFLGRVFTAYHQVARDADKPSAEEMEAGRAGKAPMPVRIVANDTADRGGMRETVASILAFVPLLDSLATAGLALILALFMLIKREDLRNRLVSFTSLGGLTTTTKALDDAGERISRYLLMQLIVNGSLGALVCAGLFLIGVPYAPLWGLCAALFRYVPFIGIWVAALGPLGVSLGMTPGWTPFVLVLALFLVLELTSGNLVEPWLYGQGMGISEVALLIAAAFWTWLWGPVGLVLSTPLTVCVAVLGKYVPSLVFLDRLLGDAPALAEHVTYLQRLLARDAREAGLIVQKYRQRRGSEEVFDGVIIPALALAKRERRSGVMTAADEAFVVETTQKIVRESSSVNGSVSETRILGCPAHHEMDELALQMLDELLQPQGTSMQVLSTKALPSEMVDAVKQHPPEGIVIAAIPPGGHVQAYYLCKRLRRRARNARIIVAYLGYRGNLDKIIIRMRSAGANYVTTTLLGARNHLVPVRAAPAEPMPVTT